MITGLLWRLSGSCRETNSKIPVAQEMLLPTAVPARKISKRTPEVINARCADGWRGAEVIHAVETALVEKGKVGQTGALRAHT